MSEYEIIPRPERRYYSLSGELNGILDVDIKCITDLHIGSGSNGLSEMGMPKRFVVMNGRPVIPGSSLKGCVRAIASTVSHSCDINGKNKCVSPNRCMVCSMFGMMNYASRIDLTEFIPVGKYQTKCVELPRPYSPSNANKGKNETKLYKADAAARWDEKIHVDVVCGGAVFHGKIFYKKLTEEQLSLLLFSLGLDGSFLLSIGGFKYNGLGRVKLSASSEQCDVRALALKYESFAGSNGCFAQVESLRKVWGKDEQI